MKKVVLLICGLILGIGSMAAQKGVNALGLNVNYGSEIENFGLGAKFQHGVTDAIRGEVAFNYFFKKNYLKNWNVEATGHYLLDLSEKATFYPLAGVTYSNWKAFEESEGKFGVNLGCGVEYDIDSKLSVGAELKYQIISDFDQIVFSVGATYKF